MLHFLRQHLAVLDFQLLGHRVRHAQGDGQVAGELVAADGDDGRKAGGAFAVGGDFDGAGANINDDDAHFALIGGQDALAGGQGVGHQALGLHFGALQGADDVVQRDGLAAHDVGFELQFVGVQAGGVADAADAVQPVAHGDGVEDLLVAAVGVRGGRGRRRGRRGAGQGAQMLLGDGQGFAAAVELLAGVGADQMVAVDHGEKRIHRVASDIAQAFGQAFADGLPRRRQVVDGAVLDAGGGGRAGAQRLELALRPQARHDGENLAGADVNGGKDGFAGHCQILPVGNGVMMVGVGSVDGAVRYGSTVSSRDTLCGAEAGAATAGVGGDFRRRRADGAASQQSHCGLVVAGANRQFRRADAGCRRRVQRAFDDAILEAVIADDGEPAAGGEQFRRGVQTAFQVRQLLVDGDA